MSLQPGTTIGPYTIVSKLGEGGMGEVYRATDSRLGRDVALKVLPDDVAADPERRARFEREAKTLAALNHFNIAQVYGFEDRAIVMELLEGETLRDRLNAGQLSIRKAIDYGIQIARGLAAAHERGIIHRDLKPENIFIVTDGHAKILDFGLAREAVREESGQTMTREGTAPGVVMGTTGYMSPEQVRGAAVDSRSDVFALGVVLFEMLTGARAFRRESTADTMSAILSDDLAGVSSVRAEIPPAVDRIVQHCLEKRPAERFQSARDVAFALEALSGSSSARAEAIAPPRRRHVERLLWAAATMALAALAAWPWLGRPAQSPSLVVSRTLLALPEDVTLSTTVFQALRMALSPDGSQVAITGRDRVSGRQQIYSLPLNGEAGTAVPGTLGGSIVSWSTDGRHLLFGEAAGLMRQSLDGGAPTLVAANAVNGQRNGWSLSGSILVGGSEIRSIDLQSGTATTVRTRPGERYNAPHVLPDGRHYLVGVSAGNTLSVRVMSLASDDEITLVSGDDVTGFAYGAGALVFARGTTVFGQRLHPARYTLEGRPVILAEGVESAPLRGSAFSVSDNGIMVYQHSTRLDRNQLAWVDRGGRLLSTVVEPADYSNLELSKDGKRLLVSATDPKLLTRDIFIIDATRGVRQRFTLDPSEERSAIWSENDRSVIFNSRGLDFYRRASDLSGEESPLLKDGVSKDAHDISPDGRLLLYRRSGGETGNDLWLLPLDGGAPRPVAITGYNESASNFSPDGRWIAYQSNESGQPEIYATRVDGGAKVQISSNGGMFPRWRNDGREIVYVAGGRSVMGAAVSSSDPELKVAAPVRLFDLDLASSAGPSYDVTADGSRFIVAVSASQSMPAITVLQNWPQLLPRQ